MVVVNENITVKTARDRSNLKLIKQQKRSEKEVGLLQNHKFYGRGKERGSTNLCAKFWCPFNAYRLVLHFAWVTTLELSRLRNLVY